MRHSRHKLRGSAGVWGVAFLAALFSPGVMEPALAQGSLESRIDVKQKELDKIKRDIEDLRRKSRQLKRQEADVMKALGSLDKEIDLSRSFLANLNQQEALITQQIDSLKVEILYESDALDRQKGALASRLRQMYKRDPHRRWDVVLGSSSIQDAMRRYKFMRIIAERDAGTVREFRDHKAALEMQSVAMTESLAEMAMVRATREEEAQQLEASKAKREKMLADIRTQASKHSKAIARLQKAQGEVKDLIGSLERRRAGQEREGLLDAGEFARLKGRLPWPVAGKLRRGFGQSRHPKYGTVTFNNGVDIEAAAGSPIQAVASGIVEFVDWIDAYGKCIIINHGGGYYTLYAHVAQTFVQQGQNVAFGAVIAEVGDSGSLDGFECHFEIRQSKKALDPIPWLEGSKPPRS
jgi:septal ring factor EnvC (AmiA/AmiB activator)